MLLNHISQLNPMKSHSITILITLVKNQFGWSADPLINTYIILYPHSLMPFHSHSEKTSVNQPENHATPIVWWLKPPIKPQTTSMNQPEYHGIRIVWNPTKSKTTNINESENHGIPIVWWLNLRLNPKQHQRINQNIMVSPWFDA